MTTPAQIRTKIATARREVTEHTATAAAQQKEIDAAKAQLRKLLKCKEGKEKGAIKALQKRIEKNQARVEELLSEVEEPISDEIEE